MIDDAGIALEAKAIDDVKIETDAYPGEEETITLAFRGSEGLTSGKLILSPEQAVQLADDLQSEVDWLGHSTRTVVDAPADE